LSAAKELQGEVLQLVLVQLDLEPPHMKPRARSRQERGATLEISSIFARLDDDALHKIVATTEDVQAEALGLWAIVDCARDKVGELEKEVKCAKDAQSEATAHSAEMVALVTEQEKTIDYISSG